MFSKAALCAALALPAFAAVHEQLAALPAGWTEVAAPDSNTIMSFSIGLQQQNIDQLESKLMAVSTPGSPQYGQHLDMDDVSALFRPTADSTAAVQSWLTGAGIKNQVSSDGKWVLPQIFPGFVSSRH